eukprot:7493187-Alexandrium_andersonii.AAC.1
MLRPRRTSAHVRRSRLHRLRLLPSCSSSSTTHGVRRLGLHPAARCCRPMTCALALCLLYTSDAADDM